MKTFRITIDGEVDYVKAKHIKDGNYYCKRIKTGNFFGVKWIGTYHGDVSETYCIAQFYDPTVIRNPYTAKIKVTKLD